MTLLCDPQDPLAGLSNVESVLSLLHEITPVSLSPTAERGRRFLLEICIASLEAILRHMGRGDPDTPGGAL